MIPISTALRRVGLRSLLNSFMIVDQPLHNAASLLDPKASGLRCQGESVDDFDQQFAEAIGSLLELHSSSKQPLRDLAEETGVGYSSLQSYQKKASTHIGNLATLYAYSLSRNAAPAAAVFLEGIRRVLGRAVVEGLSGQNADQAGDTTISHQEWITLSGQRYLKLRHLLLDADHGDLTFIQNYLEFRQNARKKGPDPDAAGATRKKVGKI